MCCYAYDLVDTAVVAGVMTPLADVDQERKSSMDFQRRITVKEWSHHLGPRRLICIGTMFYQEGNDQHRHISRICLFSSLLSKVLSIHQFIHHHHNVFLYHNDGQFDDLLCRWRFECL